MKEDWLEAVESDRFLFLLSAMSTAEGETGRTTFQEESFNGKKKKLFKRFVKDKIQHEIIYYLVCFIISHQFVVTSR